MRSKIGFVLFLMGCAGVDGPQAFASAIMFLIGLFILWTESKKNRRTHRPKQKRLLNNITMLFLYLL